MRYSKIEGDLPTDINSIVFPSNLIFKPTGGITKLDVYNKIQFQRDQSGKVFYDGKPTTLNVGDVLKIVSTQDGINGKNYWFTEGGLMIPKEKGLFKLTDAKQTIADTVPDAPHTTDSSDKSTDISQVKLYAINYGYPLLASIVLGFAGYKIATKHKKSKFLFSILGIGSGIGIGMYTSKIHLKNLGVVKKSDTPK